MTVGARPAFFSRVPEGTDLSVAETGAELLGMPLFEQGRQVGGLLEARDVDGRRLYTEIVVEEPRRATKTTSIWSVLLGRCLLIPRYRVVTTAQDGQRAWEKIEEMMDILEVEGFEDRKLGQLYRANGHQRIKFANGSLLWAVAPKPAAFRSAAADVILFDEGGELDPEKGPALLAGALPLMDTRRKLTGQDPQVVVTGTPGRQRAGLLWESLGRGRDGAPRVGILDYGVRDDEVLVSFDEDGNRTLHEKVLCRVHPGIGTVTDIETIRERFDRMQTPEFEAEYGCRWPADHTTGAFDLQKWGNAGGEYVDRPERVGIAFDVAVDGSSASIVYAWRVDGVAHVELVAHRSGSSWVAAAAQKAWLKHRRVPLAHDNIGANLDPATAMARLKPTPRLEPLNTKMVMASAQRFASDLHEGRLKHAGQVDLDAAAANTAWRTIPKSGRAFGQKDPGGAAINPVVAASLALWSYDRGKDRQPITVVAS